MSTRGDAYGERGYTDVGSVAGLDELAPIHERIYALTAHLLDPSARELAPVERLRLPFASAPTQEDFSRLMNTMNEAPELAAVVRLESVAAVMREALGTDEVEPFPICRFRAQFPGLERSRYDWHQDEGTWYAVKAKGLAHKLPATLWLSLNGSTEANSIEFVPGTHAGPLRDHRFAEGQGYFSVGPADELERAETVKVATEPGEGFVFHPLMLHRSVACDAGPPRYSVDVRYAATAAASASYPVGWKMRLKRLFAR